MHGTENTPALTTTTTGDWGSVVDIWLSRFRPATITAYGRWAMTWEDWCVSHQLNPWEAHRRDVEVWLIQLRERLAPATCALAHDAVRSLYTWLYDEELLERNPAARVQRPVVHAEAQRRTWLPPLRYAQFLEAAELMGRDEHAVAVLGGMMGMRSGEMCSLNVASLEQVGGHYVLRYTGKGGKPATSPVPVPAQRAVVPLAEDRGTGALLRSRVGARLTTQSMVRLVRRVARNAGVGELTPHGLRRTFATTGLASGISERDMMIAGRWTRSSTMDVYDMMLGQLDNHASHRIAGFLSGLSG